jgi:hypothetical protein
MRRNGQFPLYRVGEHYSEEGDREQRLFDSSGHSYISFVVAGRLVDRLVDWLISRPRYLRRNSRRHRERAFAAEGIAVWASPLCASPILTL